jgi:hypothetical protein
VSTLAPVLPGNVKAVAKELLGRVEQLRREREEAESLPQVIPDQVNDMPRFCFLYWCVGVNPKILFLLIYIFIV